MNFEPQNQHNRTLSLYRKVCGEIEPPQLTLVSRNTSDFKNVPELITVNPHHV